MKVVENISYQEWSSSIWTCNTAPLSTFMEHWVLGITLWSQVTWPTSHHALCCFLWGHRTNLPFHFTLLLGNERYTLVLGTSAQRKRSMYLAYQLFDVNFHILLQDRHGKQLPSFLSSLTMSSLPANLELDTGNVDVSFQICSSLSSSFVYYFLKSPMVCCEEKEFPMWHILGTCV